jgi:hypothetical protein
VIRTRTVTVRERSAPMTLHFDDIDVVATCHVGECHWHSHGDSVNDAVRAWTKHLSEKHSSEWE